MSIDKTEEMRRLGVGRLLGDLNRKMHASALASGAAPSKADVTRNSKLSLKSTLTGSAFHIPNNITPSPRLLVHSTHDTALAALLSTFDVFDDK